MPAYSVRDPSAPASGMAEVMEVTARVVEVAPVAEMFAKALVPVKVLLFARRVEEAAVIVAEPFAEIAVPFTVARVPESSPVPMEVVETSCLFPSSARRVEAV